MFISIFGRQNPFFPFIKRSQMLNVYGRPRSFGVEALAMRGVASPFQVHPGNSFPRYLPSLHCHNLVKA